MDRLERLVNLVAVLLDARRPLTVGDLVTKVPGYGGEGASSATVQRTFERDKDLLRQMGIPIVIEPLELDNADSPVGYRVPRERYELPDPGLDADEVAALHLAATTVRLEGMSGAQAIWKLGGVAGRTGEDAATGASGALTPGGAATAGSVRSAPASLPGSEHLPGLFDAAATRATVSFAYRGARRRVDPWRLVFRTRSWYLIGFDHDRGGRRTFRLDRFTSPPELGPPGAFSRPPDQGPLPSHPWEMGDEEPVAVTVLVDADQATFAIAYAGADAVRVRHDDGGVELELVVTNRSALRSFVLGMLDHAEVVSPPEERGAMVAWLEAIAGASAGAGGTASAGPGRGRRSAGPTTRRGH